MKRRVSSHRLPAAALGLFALFLVATGEIGSCAPERARRDVQGQLPGGLTRLPDTARYAGPMASRVYLTPSSAHVGEAIRYLAVVKADRDQRVQFQPPKGGEDLSWSMLRAGRAHPAWWRQSAYEAKDSVWFEARLQVFATGIVSVPGITAQVDPAPGTFRGGSIQLPEARVLVVPSVTAADSDQSLRGLHGPLGAPWWERLPMALIVTGLLLVAAWVFVLRKLRRRQRKPARRPAAPVLAPSRPRIDPAAEALRALFTLRAKKLPAQQRFGEHALELTAILRRFLEATVATPRPGDTSGELLERLKASRLEKADLERLEGLLGLWDRVKFARAPLTETEATRCEESVEAYVRRVAQARLEAEAAAARAAAARAAAEAGGGKPPADPKAKPPAGPDAKPPGGPRARPPGTTPSGSLSRPPSGSGPRSASSASGAPSSTSRSGPRPPAPEAA